jgi:hypothetical protein
VATTGDESRFSAVERAVFAGVKDGEGVIVDTQTAHYFGLNESAAFLWRTLQEAGSEVSEAQLVDALLGEFEVEREAARGDVREFLAHVIRYGLARRVDAAVNK